MSKTNCYFCKVTDPNEVHYDPKLHHICLICAVKLWEVAQTNLEFEIRDQTVVVGLKARSNGPLASSRKVVLSTEDEIDLADEDAFTHLFNGIIGSVMERLKDTQELSEKGWCLVHDVCLWELNYVAGQLRQAGSKMDIPFLIDQFNVQWDRISEKLDADMSDG